MLQAVVRPGLKRTAVLVFSARTVSTLPGHPYIYVFPDPNALHPSHLLTLLPNDPPRADLAIGSTTQLPPTSDSLAENKKFISILQEVLAQHACNDPGVKSQAQAMASSSGSNLGSGGAFFPGQSHKRRSSDGAGGASSQAGAGGGGRGGWIHVSDQRNPPDYGRIAWPEDIFGSLQVDGQGKFVGHQGSYQPSGTYRVATREGFLGLSSYLREKLVAELAIRAGA